MKPVLKPLLWAFWARFAPWAARAYIVGPELGDALRVARRLGATQESVTVCYWNQREDAPERVAAANLEAVQALGQLAPRPYLSIKAPAFGFDRSLLEPLCLAAGRHQIALHFDSHGPETADGTWALMTALGPNRPDLSCTLPSRWQRSLRDAELAMEHGFSVRVVKGQWPDPARPEADPALLRRQFLELIDQLAGRARLVRVATHDAGLAREALQRLQAARTACELNCSSVCPWLRPAAPPRLSVCRCGSIYPTATVGSLTACHSWPPTPGFAGGCCATYAGPMGPPLPDPLPEEADRGTRDEFRND